METTITRLVLGLTGQQAANYCRDCTQPIANHDTFGKSEGVCAACRAASGSA